MVFKLAVSIVALAAIASAAVTRRVACPDGKNTATNEACCVFFDLADSLQSELFGNICGEDAHESLRLTFHDAIGFSKSGEFQGHGADGSMIIFDPIETAFAANAGIDDSVDALSPFLASGKFPTLTAGDLIQFAGAVAVSNCPGAPRLEFLAGRPNATIPASDGTVPEPQNAVSAIFARMADAGFTPQDLVALLASHSVARSDTLVENEMAVPFDTTPFVFDTQIFLEVLLKGVGFPFGADSQVTAGAESESPLPNSNMLRLASDFAIAHDSETACAWQENVNNQELMSSNFQKAMAKLAVTGQDVSKLIDCSEAVPTPVPAVKKPATFPASTGPKDLQLSCASPFPVLSTDPGPATVIPECPDGSTDLNSCATQIGST